MKDKYLKILKEKEAETKANHEDLAKKAKTAKMLYMAAIRERIAFEEGMR